MPTQFGGLVGRNALAVIRKSWKQNCSRARESFENAKQHDKPFLGTWDFSLTCRKIQSVGEKLLPSVEDRVKKMPGANMVRVKDFLEE